MLVAFFFSRKLVFSLSGTSFRSSKKAAMGIYPGVAVMGMEKVSFGYFLKRLTPLAALGYVAGVMVFLLMS